MEWYNFSVVNFDNETIPTRIGGFSKYITIRILTKIIKDDKIIREIRMMNVYDSSRNAMLNCATEYFKDDKLNKKFIVHYSLSKLSRRIIIL